MTLNRSLSRNYWRKIQIPLALSFVYFCYSECYSYLLLLNILYARTARSRNHSKNSKKYIIKQKICDVTIFNANLRYKIPSNLPKLVEKSNN